MLALDEVCHAASPGNDLGILAKYAARRAAAAILRRGGQTHESRIDKMTDVRSRGCVGLVPFGCLGSKYRGRDMLRALQQRQMFRPLNNVVSVRLAYT